MSTVWGVDTAGVVIQGVMYIGVDGVPVVDVDHFYYDYDAKRLHVDGIFMDYTIGVVGAQIINKMAGKFSIAAGQQSVVITNTNIKSTTIVLLQLETDDGTAKSVICTPANGSFTAKLNVACTGQVQVSFVVIGTN